MSIIRKWGRAFVLPIKDIEAVIDAHYANCQNNNPILDFGAGTLFWSEKFCNKYEKEVFALDPLYNKKNVIVKNSKISTYGDIEKISYQDKFSMIFACDVLHHIDVDKIETILESFTKKSDLIVIKDISANDFLGNFQNKMHDLIINQQMVNDVYYERLEEYFKKQGYRVEIFKMKKLGYPHFLLVANR